ncbi:MAG: N-6 DNA methylase, partial [Methanobrevibacter sp.]|uniref:DNA methyltransferase n=1 Tax=Methanobrevibacter sp. TaxID=66852 RepID=UPI0026E00C0C
MVAITKEEGLKEAKKLVEKFELNEDLYKNDKYNEEQLKTEFLNPFFKALGWDVNNQQDAAPQFKEVIFEDSIKVGKETKAPDYSFRIGGQRIFFLEAKKPSRDIKNDKDHAFQVRRYGWSAQLKGSILSDFEELAIYETQTKPELNQSASISRLKYYNYKEYVEKWDEIWDLFSKEAVMKGKFNKFFKSEKKLKGTTTVDEEFLKEINQWRELLARNIALRNELLSESELNYAVQLTIDRIIFLRMAEDRGIIKYRTLYNLLDKDNIYEAFGELCLKADLKYNSGLFHFSPESKDDDGVDTFTLDLTIDDNVFKKILKNLYYPNSPYEFSMISPEILGNVYEQFLGKVITLTKGHRAKVIEKPEVKKAGGVYYTPNFIVKYIVENTVGELLKGKTPNKVSKMKILDPSCGSGSFLLEAYQFLLDWHLDYYTGLKKPPKNVIFQARNGEWLLTIQEKKRILLNNIYGVDLDENAVEVTKLSLLLKVLENQNKDSLEAQQKLTVERVLPNLKDNIKCGNS